MTKTAVSYLVGGGASKSTTTYSYDKKGNLIKEANVYKDMDGIGKTTDTFSYDKAGNLIKQVNTYSYPGGDSGKSVSTFTYQKIGA